MTEAGPEKPSDALVEQYKLYVEMADRTSARRVDTNKFYVTLLTGLLALIALAFEKEWFANIQDPTLIVASAIGLLLCIVWGINIRSYKQLNSGKFKVIHDIEKQLPFQCYECEWDLLGQGKDKKLYYPLSHVEGWVPVAIGIPYGILLIYTAARMVLPLIP
ncbi:MAG: hypothetical protein GXY52_01520 [Chloroflexi bacterium]|nr:hypothetical protein [Chloroflexota bacterium]